MEHFDSIFHRAASRHGGEDGLAVKIREHHPDFNLKPKAKPDDRWLAEFTLRIFQSGFNWSVVENKWDGFEAAFWGFKPQRCAAIDMDDMESLTTDTAIVRNAGKIKSVPINARMVMTMAEEKGSADAFIRGWDSADYIGLLDYLHKHGSRLGPNTASYALRFSGVPSFILSGDVIAALKFAGVIDKAPTSKSAKRAVQNAFNIWAEQSGHDLTTLSRVLALSIDSGG